MIASWTGKPFSKFFLVKGLKQRTYEKEIGVKNTIPSSQNAYNVGWGVRRQQNLHLSLRTSRRALELREIKNTQFLVEFRINIGLILGKHVSIFSF